MTVKEAFKVLFSFTSCSFIFVLAISVSLRDTTLAVLGATGLITSIAGIIHNGK